MASLAPFSDLYPLPRRRRTLGTALSVLRQDLARAEIERQRILDMLPELAGTSLASPILDELLRNAEDLQRYDHDEREEK